MRGSFFLFSVLMVVTLVVSAAQAEEKVLFEFREDVELKAWTAVEVGPVRPPPPPPKDAPPPPPEDVDVLAASYVTIAGDSAPKVELTAEGAAGGAKRMKITFHGGTWPGIVNTRLPVGGDWQEFNAIKLDLTVDKELLAGLRITTRKTPQEYGAVWERTIYLLPGKNEVLLYLKHPEGWGALGAKFGEVFSLAIYAYRPGSGQTLTIDNVRLSPDKPRRDYFRDPLWSPYNWFGCSMSNVADFAETGRYARFTVTGTELIVKDCIDLGARLKNQWVAPQAKTLDQVEAEFKAKFDEIRKTRPTAVLAVFRDGEKGFDVSHPDRVYAGWKDTHLDCHGPDGPNWGRTANYGKGGLLEAFMRHRALLAQVDLSSIPKGSNILAAQFVLNRAGESRDATQMATMWVAEPCMREWNEYEVNCYQYAEGKLWKAMAGCCYAADDPDFLPLFFAHGPGQGPANVWDFTEAVRFWTDGTHANHGFLFHGDSADYMTVASRENAQTKLRPAVMVIYEPKEKT